LQTLTEQATQKALSIKKGAGALSYSEFNKIIQSLIGSTENDDDVDEYASECENEVNIPADLEGFMKERLGFNQQTIDYIFRHLHNNIRTDKFNTNNIFTNQRAVLNEIFQNNLKFELKLDNGIHYFTY